MCVQGTSFREGAKQPRQRVCDNMTRRCIIIGNGSRKRRNCEELCVVCSLLTVEVLSGREGSTGSKIRARLHISLQWLLWLARHAAAATIVLNHIERYLGKRARCVLCWAGSPGIAFRITQTTIIDHACVGSYLSTQPHNHYPRHRLIDLTAIGPLHSSEGRAHLTNFAAREW
jgi:hypothetical protein